MKLAHIFGFPPKDSGNTIVALYDEETYDSSEALRLVSGKPDQNGVFSCKLPKDYRGKKVRLVALPDEYVEISETLFISPLGLYHTVKLKKEENTNLPTTHQWSVNTETWYIQSQERMRNMFREAKHKNMISKGISSIVIIGACFVGWWVAGILGLILGCALTILAIYLSDYASGQRKGI